VPDGALGAFLLETIGASVEPLVTRTLAARGGDRLPPALVSLVHAGMRIRGVLHDLYPGGHVVSTYSQAGPSAEHATFVRHVVLGYQRATHEASRAASSAVVCRLPAKKSWGKGKGEDEAEDAGAATHLLRPLPDARAALSGLFELVRDAHRGPLPFERRCSWEYAQTLHASRDEDAALRAARESFEQSFKNGFLDGYVLHFFPSFDALLAARAPSFAEVAERTFLPYLDCREVT
jgi:exonuclease V gamma subunit